MKDRLNKTMMVAAEMPSPAVDPRSGGVVECVNLRLNDSGGLTPVGRPRQLGVIGLKDIVGSIGDVYIGHDDTGAVKATAAGTPVDIIGTIGSRLCSMTPLDSNEAIAVDSRGYHYRLCLNARRDVEATRVEGSGSIVMRAGNGSTAVESPGEITLKGNYTSRSGRLDSADLKTLTVAVGEALDRAAATVLSQGCIIGPVIGRCVARDIKGAAILSTPPLLLHSPEGGSGAPVINTTLSQTGGYFKKVASSTLRLTGLSLTVELGGDISPATAEAIDHVDVLLTPTLLPVDAGGSVEAALTDYDGTECRLTVTMPGVPRAGAVASTRRLVVSALERLSSLERVVATVSGADLRAGRVTLRPAARESLSAQRARLNRVLQSPVSATVTAEGTRCSAGVMTLMGNLLVKGDITRMASPGWAPIAFSAAPVAADGVMRQYAVTTLTADNGGLQTAVAATAGNTGRIASLNPLICYPGTAARQVEMCYTDHTGAQVKTLLTLTPGADGRYCYHLSDDLAPVVATEAVTAYTMPAATASGSHHPGRVMVTSVADPSAATIVEDTPGRVTAIVEMAGGNSLEFGRRRALLATTRGVFSLGINPDASRLKIVMIDKRGVPGRGCVALDPGGLLIAAGGDLLALSGTRPVTIARQVGIESLESVRATGETWIKTAAATVVRTPRGTYYRRDDIAPALFFDNGICTIAICADGIAYNLDDESEAAATPARWSSRSKGPLAPPAMMTVDLNAPLFTGAVTLTADGGSGPSQARGIAALAIDGAIDEPLFTRLLPPLRPACYTASIAITATNKQLSINSISLT